MPSAGGAGADDHRLATRVVEEPTGKVVGEIDFHRGDAYDRKQVVDIDLGQFNLKAGTTYNV